MQATVHSLDPTIITDVRHGLTCPWCRLHVFGFAIRRRKIEDGMLAIISWVQAKAQVRVRNVCLDEAQHVSSW
jgi:hypothetical protein